MVTIDDWGEAGSEQLKSAVFDDAPNAFSRKQSCPDFLTPELNWSKIYHSDTVFPQTR